MHTSLSLLNKRRFLPLFVTQLLGAFNDNLFKNAMVFFIVFEVYNDETAEIWFTAVATAVFIIPFVLLSSFAGQLADMRDKARIIRIVKFCEILIMIVGAGGLIMAWMDFQVTLLAVPLMMIALFAMGVHSTFFGPIKYAILPQHLRAEEVLGGTGLVEAGTYIAILLGTILAGIIAIEWAALGVLVTAVIGYISARQVPTAPPEQISMQLDYNIIRSTIRLVSDTMHIRTLFLAIISISFFWTIGAVLFIQFPPLVKNVLGADKEIASLFLAIFSIGIAVGSVAINRLLQGAVSARFAPACIIVMGLFVIAFHFVCAGWVKPVGGDLYDLSAFFLNPSAFAVLATLFGIAVAGGMFVVPLYAFLTTTVAKDKTARTVAANNIVNTFAMVAGSLIALSLSWAGVPIINQLLLGAAMCLISAWLAVQLRRAEQLEPAGG